MTDFNHFNNLNMPYSYELFKLGSHLSDYVGFIKKCMKQMQKPEYKLAKKIDLEIRQLTEQEAPLTPGKYCQGIVSVMLVI